jgi:myo-inositol-1(or 4)-monophosphatase
MAQFLESARDIAREAGALIAGHYHRGVQFELKDQYDLVTVADRASETLIVERLSNLFPTHSILGEEGGQREHSSEYQWYVDPLDGTTNFAHGYPMFNVTLALARAGELICGVVYDPLHDEMFEAELGGGAYLNGKRIHTSRAPSLETALLSTGFPSRKRHESVNVHFFYQVSMCTHGIRRGGSAAIDLSYVACGRLDGFWEFGLKPWDMAAGLLLIREAGGRTTDMHGGPVSLLGPHITATNGPIHDELIGLFGEVFEGHYRYPLALIQPRD